MIAPLLRRSLPVLALALAGTLAAACSSSPSKHHSSTATTRTLPKSVTRHPHSPPPTTAPPRATTPIVVAGVEAEISSSSATISFQGPAVTGSVTPTDGSFSNGGKQFTFTITGVQYSGNTVTTDGPPTNRILAVVVNSASNGVTVQLTISPAASNHQFTVAGHTVTVSVS
jgi:hypothetical protein